MGCRSHLINIFPLSYTLFSIRLHGTDLSGQWYKCTLGLQSGYVRGTNMTLLKSKPTESKLNSKVATFFKPNPRLPGANEV